ncbi:hypothetical protein K435DRAFT_864568 [Dendrothele bispora CBS 962.96]|uniref:RlpA-like protein double-psi beta-barrel domain-containing protein n=1 Tax=Dendrothele bispora (strain CBS 962.96) TaxID=1314807 RepID=A0A4S8LMI1_DENBC|nr:hypothetical protein K435DRAFT_864568 [Dendrothele bispora CBS 962.96]
MSRSISSSKSFGGLASALVTVASLGALLAVALPTNQESSNYTSLRAIKRQFDWTGGTGEGTFYTPGLGACGVTNTESDLICAVAHEFFDGYATKDGPDPNAGNPNKNPICNKQIDVTYQGKSVTVTVVDRCEGCKGYDLDFSPTAFDHLASRDLGRIQGISWKFQGAGAGSGGNTGDGGQTHSSTAIPSGGSSWGGSETWQSSTATDPNGSPQTAPQALRQSRQGHPGPKAILKAILGSKEFRQTGAAGIFGLGFPVNSQIWLKTFEEEHPMPSSHKCRSAIPKTPSSQLQSSFPNLDLFHGAYTDDSTNSDINNEDLSTNLRSPSSPLLQPQ